MMLAYVASKENLANYFEIPLSLEISHNLRVSFELEITVVTTNLNQ